jgi:hypothetical protein
MTKFIALEKLTGKLWQVSSVTFDENAEPHYLYLYLEGDDGKSGCVYHNDYEIYLRVY